MGADRRLVFVVSKAEKSLGVDPVMFDVIIRSFYGVVSEVPSLADPSRDTVVSREPEVPTPEKKVVGIPMSLRPFHEGTTILPPCSLSPSSRGPGP